MSGSHRKKSQDALSLNVWRWESTQARRTEDKPKKCLHSMQPLSHSLCTRDSQRSGSRASGLANHGSEMRLVRLRGEFESVNPWGKGCRCGGVSAPGPFSEHISWPGPGMWQLCSQLFLTKPERPNSWPQPIIDSPRGWALHGRTGSADRLHMATCLFLQREQLLPG